ncbi:hypothetical protein [Pseudoduganella sp.]|uniref:hypothetical protein n=1 Tax=Pseudoduganella sp. TaxID=1880898 RepID=UPI0035B2DD7F
MNEHTGKAPGLISAIIIFANLALLLVIIMFLGLDSVPGAHEGHAIGLALLGMYTYGFALLCLVVGLGYFGIKSYFLEQPAQGWQWLLLVCLFIELTIPPYYFLA